MAEKEGIVKVLSREDVQLASLRLPGEVARLARDSSLDGLVLSIQETFLFHPLIIRKRDARLISGRKRSAAALRAGLKEVPVVFVDCSDQEADIMTEVENACRLHDRQAQKEAMLRLIHLRTAEIESEGAPPEQVGRRKSPRAVAISEVADATGYSESYLRTEDYRLRRRKEQVQVRKRKKEFELKTLGVIPDKELVQKAEAANNQITKVARLFKRFQKEMQKLSELIEGSDLEHLVGFIAANPSEFELWSRPAAVCPHCKSFDKLRVNCDFCRTKGWISPRLLMECQPELLDEEKICVLVEGKVVPVEEAGVIEDEGWM
jgi:ParB-like chromosome segregation protein Spo0J